MEIDNRYWYAMYTAPRSERKVRERIAELGMEAYVPLFTQLRIWSDRKKKVTSPLISSYVFVKIEEKEILQVLQVQGVVGVLKHLRKPALIKEFEIENLKILMNDAENVTLIDEVNFGKGDTVRVIKGPFQGLIAECFEVKGKHRIIAAIHNLNSVFEVNVPVSFVEKY
jgi:transcription antitermination factor NusG